MKLQNQILLTVILLLLVLTVCSAQSVSGSVQEAATAEPIPFANILFLPGGQGVTADEEGNFSIADLQAVDTLVFSALGFASQLQPVNWKGQKQLVIKLAEKGLELEEVSIRVKKKKYKRKGNPAIALIKEVIAHKDDNRPESQDFYQYEKYEKLEIDLTNVGKRFFKIPIVKQFSMLNSFIDSTDGGMRTLPFFLQESLAKVYYRKDPPSTKTYRNGLKLTQLDDEASAASVALLSARLYQKFNIYDDQIVMVDQHFVSPLSRIAPTFYRYYIKDTLVYNGRQAVHLSFLPVNKYDLGFYGDLYISTDGRYQLLGVDMRLLEEINLNFVQNLRIHQSFVPTSDSLWVKGREEISATYSVSDKLIGFTGRRTAIHFEHVFNQSAPAYIYEAQDDLIPGKAETFKSDTFWEIQRPEPLSEREQNIYLMIDTLKALPAFKTTVTAMKILTSGYVRSGNFDIGSLYTFVSSNQIEGLRLKFGGRTNEDFSPKIRLHGHVAYGFMDRRWKHGAGLRYALTPQYERFPDEYIQFSYENDNRFPGASTDFLSNDNVFMSVALGNADKMVNYELYRFDYFKEMHSDLSIQLSVSQEKQRPTGRLRFPFTDRINEQDQPAFLEEINTAELGLAMTYAPDAEYIEGMYTRSYLPTDKPVISLSYRYGIPDFLAGEYQYHALQLSLQQQLPLPPLGFTSAEIRGGKIWGEGLPYLLTHMPNANQTIAYQDHSFNLMRFMEFAADEYVQVRVQHHFYGFLLNKVPLIRRLKLREIVGVHAFYGRLTTPNNPNLNPQLVQFIADEQGRPETYTLNKGPYIEGSAGIYNILKFGQLIFVKRFNYLDHPNVPALFGVKGLDIRLGLVFGL